VKRPTYRVWDPLVRTLHWTLALSVALAWLTKEGGGVWHEWIGYVSLAAVGLRVAWGWSGSRHARFSAFVRSPGETLRYLRRVLARSEPRHLGHNPLGGWMIVALIVNVVLVGASGWLYTTDAYWGVEWVEDLHDALATSLLTLAALHVTGVVLTSVRHRENLAGAMVHGRKRPPEGGDRD